MQRLVDVSRRFALPVLAVILAAGCASTEPAPQPAKSSHESEPATNSRPPYAPEAIALPVDRDAKSQTAAVRDSKPASASVQHAPPVRPPPDVRIVLASARASLGPQDLKDIQEIAARAKRKRRVMVFIESYSSWRGSRELNVARAQQRAEEVKDALLKLGVPAACLHTTAYGEERKGSAPGQRFRIDIRVVEPAS